MVRPGDVGEVLGRVLLAHPPGLELGQPPYGYVAEKIPHPVPARRAEGKTKSRLVPDPVRAQAVREIFAWRVVEGLEYAEITERLNADLERYPPPSSPDPARRKDHWSRFSVREILLNPKYTGYMVWNRRARKRGGKTNSPEAWVWSSQPTHEAIVSRSMLDAALAVAKGKQGSGARSEPTAPSPGLRGATSSGQWSGAICAEAGCSARSAAATSTIAASPSDA